MERGWRPWEALEVGVGQHWAEVEVETGYGEQAGPGELQLVLSAG